MRKFCGLRVSKGRTSALKVGWENAISGKQTDGVEEATLAVLVTELIVDSKHNRLLLLQRRRHRLTEEIPRKALAQGEKLLLEGKVKDSSKLSQRSLYECVM